MNPNIPILNTGAIQFVVKITKFCNLRCKYCYEFPHLGDPTKMDLAQIEILFRQIITQYQHRNKKIFFTWHGGEPFIVGVAYYRQIFALQKQLFEAAKMVFSNRIQTNLTILDATWIAFLKEEPFDGVSISLDLFGGERVNIAGKPVEDKVLDNMQRLLDNGIPFGAITVLSRKTVEHALAIYQFFEDIKLSGFRFLPVHHNSFDTAENTNGLSCGEILDTYQKLFDNWLIAENSISIDPIDEYLEAAIQYLNPNPVLGGYDKAHGDALFVINTDGGVYSNDYDYERLECYGNIFVDDFQTLFASAAYQRAIEASQAKIQSVCHQCEYFGYCPGYRIGEGDPEEVSWNENGELECSVIRPLLTHMIRVLKNNHLEKEIFPESFNSENSTNIIMNEVA
jgi:uncharacterized protein